MDGSTKSRDNTASPVFLPDVERWAALRMSARWEKQIAQALNKIEIPTFLPLMSKIVHYKGKRRESEVPLFPGYVFCSELDFRGNSRIPQGVRNRIAQLLVPPDYKKLHQELTAIAEFLSDNRLVQERLVGRPGDVVRVKSGMFAGQSAIIRELRPDQRRLTLEISFLGVRLEVELGEDQVSRL
jgi:transcription antitermination factor NusG